jgi:hypothetical protein
VSSPLVSGAETTVDLYGPAAANNQLVWTSLTLPVGFHTVKVRVTGRKSSSSSAANIAVDRVEYQ